MSQYLWENKHPKIALKTLQLSKECGDLDCLTLENKQKALKIQWVKRIQDNNYFRTSFQYSFPMAEYKHFWQCNINKKDIGQIQNSEFCMIFWQEVLEYWCEVNHNELQNSNTIRKQIYMVKFIYYDR